MSYDLDGAANRLSERIVDQNQALIAEKRYRYNIRDQLERIDDAISGESTSYGYNAIGQQIHKTDTQGTTQYQYNSRRRLSTITLPNQQIEQHQYDDQGLRVSTEFNGTRKHYRYDGQSLIQETNVQGNLIARYTWSDQGLISENRNGLQTYLHTDALATPIAITDTSAAVVDRYRYDAWGHLEQHQGTSQQPFGFTGYQNNNNTGLYYAQQRYYNSETGRFLSHDPFAGDINTPISLHRYLYANASPAVFTDPDGRVAVIQGGEVKRLQAAADESKGIVGLSEGITSLIRARGQSDLIGSEVRTYRRGHPIYDESLSSAGVKTVVQSISNAIGGDHSASALIVVEDDDTPETVLNFARDFVGDTDSVITEYVLKNLVKNGVEAGQILDISLEFNAGLASANRRIEDLFLSEVANVSTDLRNSSGFNNIVFFASDLIVQQTAQIATDITITDLNPTTPRAPAVLADQANFNITVEVALSLSPLTRGLFRTRAPATEASGNVYDPDFIGPVQWEYFYRGDATPRSNFLSAMSQRDGSEATDSFIDSLSGGARSEILSEHGVSSISSPFISTSKNPKVAQYFAGGPDQSQNGYLTTFRIEAREVKRLRDQGQIVPNFENPMSFFEPNLDIGVPEAEFLFLNSIEERYIYEQTPVRRK